MDVQVEIGNDVRRTTRVGETDILELNIALDLLGHLIAFPFFHVRGVQQFLDADVCLLSDEVLFAELGKHLNRLQDDRQTYQEGKQRTHCEAAVDHQQGSSA